MLLVQFCWGSNRLDLLKHSFKAWQLDQSLHSALLSVSTNKFITAIAVNNQLTVCIVRGNSINCATMYLINFIEGVLRLSQL